jgi:hypothetical protein
MLEPFLTKKQLAAALHVTERRSVVCHREEGRIDHYVFPESTTLEISMRRADAVVVGADGKEISNTRRERIERRKAFARSASAHIADDVVNSILRSYAAAVTDPRNELVHLYEIRDALCTHFKGEKSARHALGVSADDWSTLGKLSCSEPLLQGRHRGQYLRLLRDATEDELLTARRIARNMIERYLANITRGT